MCLCIHACTCRLMDQSTSMPTISAAMERPKLTLLHRYMCVLLCKGGRETGRRRGERGKERERKGGGERGGRRRMGE